MAYDCLNCPGYCCSYPVIPLTKRDVERLAKHYGMSIGEAGRKFTKSDYGHKRIMRRKKDHHFGRICRFFDTDARRCTVYSARPVICREYPRSEE
ncbi:MAG: YkgJ family cysteine cluster protein, partial [Pseudomonadota bacterium]